MNSTDLPFSDRVKKIGELLKSADRNILAGEFDKAIEDVKKVFDFDPKNIYAKAYLNRIEVFKKQKEKKQKEETPPSTTPKKSDSFKEDEKDFPPTDSADVPLEPSEMSTKTWGTKHADKHDEEERKSESYSQSGSPTTDSHPPKSKLTLEQERKLIEDIVAKEAERLPVSSTQPGTKAAPSKELSKEKSKEKQYLAQLEIAWGEGKISPKDEEMVTKLRDELGISNERHKELERRAKLSSYVKAVKKAWEEGAITPTGAKILEDLREQYDISLEEHLKIESRIMYELHGLKSKGIVMIIDDDTELVKIIKTILRDEGYATFSASNPEDGLQILEDTLPDLILLDITFPKPSMSGFTMYEKLREHPRLKLIPVVFLTGLDEEHVVQIGKKLGADDYIVKPCSDHMLLSTVEGKVKRYKEIRAIMKEQ